MGNQAIQLARKHIADLDALGDKTSRETDLRLSRQSPIIAAQCFVKAMRILREIAEMEDING